MNYITKHSLSFTQTTNYLNKLRAFRPKYSNQKQHLSKKLYEQCKYDYKHHSRHIIADAIQTPESPLDASNRNTYFMSMLRLKPELIHCNLNWLHDVRLALIHESFKDFIHNATRAKKVNQQLAPIFKDWVDRNSYRFRQLGISVVHQPIRFLDCNKDMIFNSSDKMMKQVANHLFGYRRHKGLDFLARISGIYIFGEDKIITNNGGNQNNQFRDVLKTIHANYDHSKKAMGIGIVDGICYLNINSGIGKRISDCSKHETVVSAFMLPTLLGLLQMKALNNTLTKNLQAFSKLSSSKQQANQNHKIVLESQKEIDKLKK